MGGNARLDHAFLGNDRKVEVVTGGMSELLHKDALRSSVALTEGMDGIYLGHDVARLLGKFLTTQATQIVRPPKLFSNGIERDGDGGANSE